MKKKITKEDALAYHELPNPGKIAVVPTKAMDTDRDLSLAYSPGVAYACLEIEMNAEAVYKYTSKGNTVAVISNGTAVLGLGNIGYLASKPVMEGKAILMKKFANVDAIDIEINEKDPEKLAYIVSAIGDTWGGINLEDIKAPECFIVEDIVKKNLNIPVFHDDQHGTAIVALAALINSCKISNRNIEDAKIVINGAGAAGIACAQLFKNYGFKNIVICDTKGVIYKGRPEGMNPWKEKHAVETSDRTLADAVNGSDMLLGLSVKGAFTNEMIASMNDQPVVLAMANPDPEMLPDEIKAIKPDAIVGTGRSDYPNQVNNLMCFPYLFRGALDARAVAITEKMKLAAAVALAELAQEPVTEEVKAIYEGRNLVFGPDYIIPTPFDSRLLEKVSTAVMENVD